MEDIVHLHFVHMVEMVVPVVPVVAVVLIMVVNSSPTQMAVQMAQMVKVIPPNRLMGREVLDKGQPLVLLVNHLDKHLLAAEVEVGIVKALLPKEAVQVVVTLVVLVLAQIVVMGQMVSIIRAAEVEELYMMERIQVLVAPVLSSSALHKEVYSCTR